MANPILDALLSMIQSKPQAPVQYPYPREDPDSEMPGPTQAYEAPGYFADEPEDISLPNESQTFDSRLPPSWEQTKAGLQNAGATLRRSMKAAEQLGLKK